MPFNYATSYMNGLYFEILPDTDPDTYTIEIYDEKMGTRIYLDKICPSEHIQLFDVYFKLLRITVTNSHDKKIISVTTYDLMRDKRFFIDVDSSSLGDTIAWMGMIDKFAEEHMNTEVIVTTFHNYLFEKQYPYIKFVPREEVVNELWGMVKIGIYYNKHQNPNDPRTVPLHQVAADILCIKANKPRKLWIDFTPDKRYIDAPYYAIATESTADFKEWPESHWQHVVDNLKDKYKCVDVSKNPKKISGTIDIASRTLPTIMQYLYHAEFFIGLSSGLSWLAWAMNKKVYMIANFSEPWYEFQCERFINTDVCHGCFNNPIYRFDRTRKFCPFHADTESEYICQKSIPPKTVVDKIRFDRY